MIRFSSVYMTVIASNLILILLTIFMNQTKILLKTSHKLMTLFLVVTAIRFLLPFEFPRSHTIALSAGLSSVVTPIQHILFYVHDHGVSIWSFVKLLWLIGILILLAQDIRKLWYTHLAILLSGRNVTAENRYAEILERICRDKGRRNHFRVIILPGINSPRLHVFRYPYILLPEGYDPSEQDLYYILCHETAHYFHHDVVLKTAVHLLRILYWWNPCSKLLERQIDKLLEIQTDDSIAAEGPESAEAYISCLKNALLFAASDTSKTDAFTIGLHGDTDILEKRFAILENHKRKQNYFINAALTCLILAVYISSYAFVFEAHNQDILHSDNLVMPSAADTYIILNEDNTYDMYFGDIYIQTLDSLEYYSNDIPIYTKEELHYESE